MDEKQVTFIIRQNTIAPDAGPRQFGRTQLTLDNQAKYSIDMMRQAPNSNKGRVSS